MEVSPPNWVSAFWHFKGRDSFLRSSTFRWITACCRNNERLLLCPAAQPSPANHCALHKPSLDTLKPAEGTFAPSCLIIYCIIIIILPLLWLQTFIQIVLLSFSTVDASMMSGLSGKHMPPSLPPSLHPSIHPCSTWLISACFQPTTASSWSPRPCGRGDPAMSRACGGRWRSAARSSRRTWITLTRSTGATSPTSLGTFTRFSGVVGAVPCPRES